MTTKTDTKTAGVPPPTNTLPDVLDALKGNKTLSEIRRRDLCSAPRRVAFLLGDDPDHIVLNLPVIAARLAAINPAAAGLTNKRFITIKSDFMAAVAASGLTPIPRFPKAPFSTGWKKFITKLSGKRAH